MKVEIKSRIKDEKIRALNVLIELHIKSYLKIAKEIIENNPMQRKRVKSSKTVYSLLRSDLKEGCTIPPIILAVRKEAIDSEDKDLDDLNKISDDAINKYIKDYNLIILDGLQRTYQMIELESELKDKGDDDTLEHFYNKKIRLEIYVGINKMGILYRMLTLNTGQTPMSIRHQIEILYQDYIEESHNKEIELIREVEGGRSLGVGVYKFSDMIDGFHSYLEVNELSIDRSKLLDDIQSLDKIAKKGQEIELFQLFINNFHNFIKKIDELSNSWTFDKDKFDYDVEQPFGKDISNLFLKSQVITGFGAAVGSLEDLEFISDITEVENIISKININDDINVTFNNLLNNLEYIRTNSKKIGNSQRRYFYHFFKSLLSDDDCKRNIDLSIKKSLQKYKVEFL